MAGSVPRTSLLIVVALAALALLETLWLHSLAGLDNRLCWVDPIRS